MIETEVPLNFTIAPLPETLTIVITPEDVERGERLAIYGCPVALATKRALKEWAVDVSASYDRVVCTLSDDTKYYWEPSDTLRASMRDYDGGRYNCSFEDALGEHHLRRVAGPIILENVLKFIPGNVTLIHHDD
jgi:hypothetical protein